MNPMLKLFGLLVFSDVLNAEYVDVQFTSDEDLARAALRSVFGPGKQQTLRPRIQRSTESTASDRGVIQSVAEESVAATIIFKQGYTANEVEILAGKYAFELAAAQAKVSTNDDSSVLTLSIGSAVLLLLEKSFPLSTRLDMAIGNQTQILLAAEEAGRDKQDDIQKASHTPDWRFYRVDVITSNSELARLSQDSSVAAISNDRTGSMLADYRCVKERMSQLELSPMPAVPGIADSLIAGPPVSALPISAQQSRR